MTDGFLDLSLAERIDAICDQFKQDFRAGQQPQIESCLGESQEPFRSKVLQALVGLDVALRQSQGDIPSVDEYVARFPNQAEVVQEAFTKGHSILSSVKVSAAETSKKPSPDPAVPATDSKMLQHLGRFQVLSVLGEGAFGTVYKAHDPQLDRDVAIKVPRAGLLLTAEDRERFLREARAAAGLHHALICPVHEVGTIDGRDYIVMAFIDGKPLSKVIKTQAALTDKQIANVVRRIALALQEAHEKGIIHRDLKPANIMINRKGEPVIMDFGLARRDNAGDAQISQSGQIMGTPAYMSPEQARGDGKAVGPGADIYSLGVVFYEMLCGRRPFEGTITEVIGKILHVAADPPSTYRDGIDARLQEICLKSISKKSTDRYASMKELAAALAEYLKDAEKTGPTDTKLPAQTVTAPATPAPTSTSMSTSMVSDKQKNITQFIQQGQLPAALEALKGVLSHPDPQLSKWAKEQTAKIKAEIKKWQEQVPTLTALGHKLIRKCDYAEAKNILSQIPAGLRPAEIQKTLEEAEEKQEECDLLQMEIEEAIRKEYAKELPSLVKRFLQLKPGHKAMQKLAEELKQYGPDRAIRLHKGGRAGQAKLAMNVKLIAAVACGFIALFAGVLFAVMVFITPQGTVIIEVHDKEVAVTFANDEVTVDSSGKKYKLKTTDKKTLKVLVDGIEIESATQEITVSKNETKLITAKLLPGKQLELAIDREMKTFATPDKKPGTTTPDQGVVSTPAATVLDKGEPWTWSDPVHIGRNVDTVDGNEAGVALDLDERTIYFGRHSQPQGQDLAIWRSNRPSKTAAFEPAVKVDNINSGRGDGSPTLSGDGLTIFYDALRDGQWDLLTARRPSLDAPFGSLAKLPGPINTDANEAKPSLTDDGLMLFFHSDRPLDNNKLSIWVSTRKTTNENFGAPAPLGPTINAGGLNGDPAISSDGRKLIFYSDRQGGLGGMDLWMATRPSRDVPFGPANNLGPKINTTENETKPTLSRDEQALYFRSRRGDRELWVSQRQTGKPTSVSIPADAVTFNGHSYKFFPEKLSWTDAKRRCEQLGGHLPMVESKEENDFLVKLCEGKFPKSDKLGGPTIWLGATDEAKEGEWVRIDGKPMTYSNWYKVGKQPNNGGQKANEHYATMLLIDMPNLSPDTKAGQWSDQPDMPVQQDVYFVCEWDSVETASPVAAGWTELFSGKNLSAWVDVDGKPAAWKVENGYTEVAPNTKNIVTRENFPLDFELHAEFWVPKEPNRSGQGRGNSGIYLHGRHEIQILDSIDNPIPEQTKACGALYGEIAPTLNASTPPETWQTFDITFRSPRVDGQQKVVTPGRLTIIHNGKKVIDDAAVNSIGSPGGRNDNPGQPGPIMLQDHGNPVRFRNIRIRPLESAPIAADGWKNLLNGQDLTGWKAVGAPKWSWSNGRLLAPAGGAGFLMTEADYEDFELELQFRLNPGLGSGLFLRTDPNAEITGRLCVEVQIADDDAFKLQPINATGSVYNVFARKANPPLQRGDWNSMRVRLVQRRIEVWVNEVQTVDADLDSAGDKLAAVPGLSRKAGRIGLQQNQKADVEYRNIRIRPLGSPTAATNIPADAQTFNGHAYKFFPEQLAWKAAKAKCETLGGHLIIVDNAEENAFAAKLVEAAGWVDCWISATDEAKEGGWRTVKGDPLPFVNWYKQQPNNKPPGEHWALFSNTKVGNETIGWMWCDQPNEAQALHKPGYLCEWDLAKSAAALKAPSLDGQLIISACVDQQIRIWKLHDEQPLHTLKGHGVDVFDAVFTPDLKFVVSGANDNSVRVWDIATKAEVRRMEKHTGGVRAVAVSPDGQRILSAGDDRTARLWDLSTGAELAVFKANQSDTANPRVSDVQFSPDGKYGLTCAFDGSVRLPPSMSTTQTQR